MKKKNWLMTIAFAVLALTIVSTCVIGSTYAKFIQKVDGAGTVQAAGFRITANTTTPISANTVLAPEEAKEVTVTVNYFSQVNTHITTAENLVSVSGAITNDNWASLITTYNASHGSDGKAVPTTLKLSDVFKVEIITGTNTATTDIVDGFLALAQTAGLTVDTTNDTISAMPYSAYAAIPVAVTIRISWAHDYITAASTEPAVSASDIMDSFDTYLGGVIADREIAANAEASVRTTVAVTVPLTATQVVSGS